MYNDVLEAIQHLMDSGIGDFQRLDYILTSLKEGKKIYSSDQRYLETLISQNIKNDSSSKLIEESKNLTRPIHAVLKKKSNINTSPLWYYLPLFFNIVGGIIVYVVLRKLNLEKSKKCLTLGLILFLIPVGIFIILNIVPGMQYSLYMAKTNADDQNLKMYDVAIIDSNIPIENIKIGDVIIFYNPSTHQEILAHRVVNILAKDPFTIKTKGDKSPESISGLDYPIKKQEYIGKLVYIIPQVGYITKIVTGKSVLIGLSIIVGIGIVQHVRYRRRSMMELKNVPSDS